MKKHSEKYLAATMTMAAMLISAAAQGQITKPPRPKPIFTAVITAPVVQLTPRCERIDVLDMIKKITINSESGKVVFKMSVSGTPDGLVVSRLSDNVSKAVANGQDTPAIDPDSDALEFKLTGGGASVTGFTVGSQTTPPMSGTPLYHVWQWPTGRALWFTNRWAMNKCNNQPIKPLIATEKPAVSIGAVKNLVPVSTDPVVTSATAGSAEIKDPQ